MDTQPLLRVNSIKPQNKQPTTAPDSNGQPFDHHLKDQIQHAQAPEPPAKSPVKGEKSANTPATQTAGNEPHTTEQTEESAAASVDASATDTTTIATGEAEIVINLLALTDEDTDQSLPQDGNILPSAVADILVPQELVPDEKRVVVLTGELATKNTAAAVTDKTAVVASRADVSDLIQLSKNEASTQVLQQVSADDGNSKPVIAPDIKLQIKSDDVMSDKQFAALIAEANKNTALSMQQVQAVTGNAAANIQNYVAPQFTTAQAATSTFNGSVNVPVNHPGWGNQLGDQLVFMLQGKLQSAEIKLNPAHLGPMEIRLSMHEDKASVTFISAHAPVREALDASLPRLRDMMEQQGLNLANVDVSAHSGGQREAFDQHNQAPRVAAFDNQQNETAAPVTVVNAQIETGLSVFV